MAVIRCNNCEVGVHYTDVCWGGKNGKPRLTKQEHRNLTIRSWIIPIGIVVGIDAIVLFLVK
jgi:hypothetical protein